MSNAKPMRPDELRALLDQAEDRDLGELEARRLEEALAADPALSAELFAPLPGEEFLPHDVEAPTELEWRRIDGAIAAGTGTAGDAEVRQEAPTGAGPEKDRGGSKSRSAPLIPIFALAAAVVLCALVVRMIVSEGLAEPETPPVAEVLDLREDASPFIMNLGDDEDGGVIIYVTSS